MSDPRPRRGAGARRLSRRFFRHLVEPAAGSTRRIPSGPARGITFAAEPAATASADMWFGLFESELAGYVRRYARPGVRCVDVGANSGYYTLMLAHRTGVPVTAYEPDPTAHERLSLNLELNPRLRAGVDLRSSLVGARTDSQSNTVALDDDLADRAMVGLLKVDVDGPEALVLAGASRLLTETRPHVIVETHSAALEAECATRLLDAGYRPRVLTARRWMAQNRAAEHNRWLVADGVRPPEPTRPAVACANQAGGG